MDVMTEPAVKRGGIAWDHYGRWFLRGRVFPLAVQSRLLTLAALGLLFTLLGWEILTEVFSGSKEPAVKALLEEYRICPWKSPETGPSPLIPLALTARPETNS